MRYVVLKIEDIENYCTFEQQEKLMDICNEIEAGRLKSNKEPENRYLVVNTDEPYADKVSALIEEHDGEKVNFE